MDSVPLLRKRLLPGFPKIFTSKKNIIPYVFIFNKYIQEHTEYDLFVCGDTLGLMACGYSLRRLFMNYNEPTYQQHSSAGSDYKHLFFGFFLFSFCSSLWRISLIIPLCCCFAVPFLLCVFSSVFASASILLLFFFFLVIFFFIDESSISVADLLFTATTFLPFYSFLMVYKNVT